MTTGQAGTVPEAQGRDCIPRGQGKGWPTLCKVVTCPLFQTGIPGLDWSEAIKIHKGETRQSHHNP